ncbi:MULTISPECIES: endonuclease/exonuclease/phosphatase family protein [unclassified Aureispira]|uniref:endonuclease/exonuclease/phosphatase family protein n=1 Tax=unclassified Aureispira TaxID=2649989 RepID=UPI000697B721|nr:MULTISPECIES: endonuclease/exonuclease/phosphatase family protein [unclassified Aureispira]WMX14723.1 endonuclease/exonuclease/phosphatase family protein [Aureispira sp. CCB-E]
MFRWLKNTFTKLLFGANIIVSLLLLCSYLAIWIPPSTFYWFALLANGYPFLLLINLLFAFLWLYRRKRYFYLSLIAIFLGGSHLFNLIGFNWSNTAPSENSVRIMSYNVRYFNATALSDKKKLEQAQQKILRTIEAQAIDIFCGQEFSGKTARYNQTAKQFLEDKMGLTYHFQGGGSSLAIFSKYPILKKGTIDFPNSYNGAIYADLKYHGKTIRVYCFHLQSIGLGSDEHELFDEDNLSTLGQNATQKKYQRINNKLKEAFLQREEQANFIAQHIHNSPYPVLVCGDMNDTPSSYAYGQLAQNLTDAFREKGSGLGSTYAGLLPFLRIDYIFTSPINSVEAFRVVSNTSSDHYPIYTHIRF